MRKFYYIMFVHCLMSTIISCGQTTEENVSDAVSLTNDAINDTTGAIDDTLFGDTNGVSCPNVGTFQKNYSALRPLQ